MIRAIRLSAVPALTLIGIMGAIEAFCIVLNVAPYIFPRPSSVAKELLARWDEYLLQTGITAAEAALGFVIGGLSAFLVGVLFVQSRWVERAMYPYAIALKAVPIVALAPILIVWFGAGLMGKVIMAALVCFFPVVVGATTGMKSVGREVTDLFSSLGATRWQALWKLRIPASLPQLFSALKVSATLSVVGAIVAELSGSLRGLGFIILVASYEVQTVRMFAAIACASFMGMLFFAVVCFLERAVMFWHEAFRVTNGEAVESAEFKTTPGTHY